MLQLGCVLIVANNFQQIPGDFLQGQCGSAAATPIAQHRRPSGVSQITPATGPKKGTITPPSQSGFKQRTAEDGQQLVMLSVEIHADCRYRVTLHHFYPPKNITDARNHSSTFSLLFSGAHCFQIPAMMLFDVLS